eukprot:scaffold2442_cov181-Pinguiococcus_pyrenoidosus.AAC.1
MKALRWSKKKSTCAGVVTFAFLIPGVLKRPSRPFPALEGLIGCGSHLSCVDWLDSRFGNKVYDLLRLRRSPSAVPNVSLKSSQPITGQN